MYEFRLDPTLFQRLLASTQYWDTLNQEIIVTYPHKNTGLSFRRGKLFCYVDGVETHIERELIVTDQRTQLEKLICRLFMKDFETGNYDLLS